MSLRIAILFLLSFCGACSSSSPDSGASPADGAISARSLQFVGGAAISLLPNTTRELSLQYADLFGGPIDSMEIDFALTGSAPGASLSPSRAVTDALGVARTTLRVGSTPGDVQVRARTADNVVTTFAQVTVSEALGVQLAVTVSYEGKRQLASYTVTSLPGMTCDAALQSGLSGEQSFTIPVTRTAPVNFDFGSGVTAAIVGLGRDASGAKLALGCQEFTAVITADSAQAKPALTLTLDNQRLSLDDALDVQLAVTLPTAAQRVSESAVSAVASALSAVSGDASLAEANFYLDAVAATLTTQNNGAALAALAAQRAAGTLASSLASTLSRSAVGPKAVGAKVGALLLDRGATLILGSSLQTGALGPVKAVGALSTDGTKSLTLTLTPLPTASISSSFSSDSAQLLVSSLEVSLPLGRYAVAVLMALVAEVDTNAPPMPAQPIEQAAGCSTVFQTWWMQQGLASVSDVRVAVAACETGLSALLVNMQTQLHTLDALAPKVELRGTVQAEDRMKDDSQIDDLGPASLTGTWGADSVTGNVSVPVKSAFAH